MTLAEDADPATVIAQAIAGHEELATTEGVHTTALALDPRRWELVHFTLWADNAPRSAGDCYQVLHLSAPGTGALGEGRQW